LIKFVDPSTDVLRLGYNTHLDDYLKIKDIPAYFEDYLKKFKANTMKEKSLKADPEGMHISFWRNLLEGQGQGTIKAGHFIKWQDKTQKNMGGDVFIAPSPYITRPGCDFLVEAAIKINSMSQALANRDVADTFYLDAEIFKDKRTIERIAEYLGTTHSQMILFKIKNQQKLIDGFHGKYALKNLQFLLSIIKNDARQFDDKVRTYGLLNGGGFGYCLLGAGFDFFTDPVGNFEYPMVGRKKDDFRGTIGSESLVYEPFEELCSLLHDYGESVLPHHPEGKYNNTTRLERRFLTPDVWRRDCKLNGLCLWNEYVNDNVQAMINRQDRLVFDRVANSSYARLAPIVKDLNSF